jgi:hypothetical protein
MKYIKIFEFFVNIPFVKSYEDKYSVTYSFTLDNDICDVHFVRKPNNVYERQYNFRKNRELDLVNKNPYLIINVVTNITQSFINEYSPDILVISHVSDKKSVKNELNMRAKLNYRFLKNIKGYKFDYFYYYSTVVLYLSKNEVDIYDEDKYPSDILNLNIKINL